MKSSHGIYINKTGRVAYRIDWCDTSNFVPFICNRLDIVYLGVSITLMSEDGLHVLYQTNVDIGNYETAQLIFCEMERRAIGTLPRDTMAYCTSYFRNPEIEDMKIIFGMSEERVN